MESLVLVDFGIDRLGDNDVIIRYWAVKSISRPAIAAQLNSEMTGDDDVADKIVTALDKIVETESYGEILDLIVGFAASIDTIRARELLLKFADMRIAAYEDWSVSNEHIDAVLLNGLGGGAAANSVTRREAGQKFAQLYSYVIQRFISGKDVLSEKSLAALASVIVDVEANAVVKLLGRSQRAIRTAVEKKTYPALQREHDDLLGLPGIAGKLPVKLSFDYGKGPSGTLTAPKKLAPPAKPEEAEAATDAE
jgi:ABC-type amino acid transport substrate-binding protein